MHNDKGMIGHVTERGREGRGEREGERHIVGSHGEACREHQMAEGLVAQLPVGM